MNLKHLAHWLALAETGSFSRAAEKLHITQSALSRSIHVLEEELGGPLVDRVGKKNEMTPLSASKSTPTVSPAAKWHPYSRGSHPVLITCFRPPW